MERAQCTVHSSKSFSNQFNFDVFEGGSAQLSRCKPLWLTETEIKVLFFPFFHFHCDDSLSNQKKKIILQWGSYFWLANFTRWFFSKKRNNIPKKCHGYRWPEKSWKFLQSIFGFYLHKMEYLPIYKAYIRTGWTKTSFLIWYGIVGMQNEGIENLD